MSKIYSLYNNFKTKKYSYFVSYTLFFCFISVLMFWYFPLFHKSFIWQQDGLKQHYNGLLYYAKYLKDIFRSIFSGGGFALPMWDHSIGYGSDIITTLHYYAIGDPLTLFSVFVPLSVMEFFYAFLFFLRAYIGGLGFSLMSLERGNSRFYTCIASVIYCFSAFSLALGMMHGIFMVPVCYFPWMIYGADRIFKGKSPLIFILSTAAAAAANFYFLYMEVLLAVLYIVHRFISEERDRYGERQDIKTYLKDLLKRGGEFMAYGVNAFLLSAVILLPVLNVMLSSKRFAADKYVPFLYSPKHYLKLIADFMITRRATNWTLMGYTVTGALAVLLLYTCLSGDREFKRMRFRFTVLTIFTMIPFIGFMLNGFAYVANRWTFAYALSAAMVIATVFSGFRGIEEDNKSKIIRIMMLLIWLGAAFFFVRTEESLLSMVLLLVTLMIFMYSGLPVGFYKPLILVVTVMSLFLNGWFAFSTVENDFLDEFLDFHDADNRLNDMSFAGVLEDLNDDSFYRTEITDIDHTQNSTIQTGFKGTQFYFSLTSPYISEFINGMYFNWPKDYDYEGVDFREALEALAAVKYYIAGKDGECNVPAGFELREKKEINGTEAGIYENKNALPLGFGVDGYIPRKAFDDSSVTERQQALLSGVVLEDEDVPEIGSRGYTENDFSDDSAAAITAVEGSGDMDVDQGSFTVRRNGSITVRFNGGGEGETCFFFKNLVFKGFKEREMYSDSAWGALTPYEQAKVRDKNTTDSRPGSTSMMISYGDRSRIIEYYSNRQDFYCGRHDFLTSLGNTGEGEQTLTVSFREPGVYTFDAMEIRNQPVSTIEEKLGKLREYPLTDIEVGQDEIRGEYEADKDTLLMLSIPYSTGWKAFIDGKEERILKGDLMYMAVPVSRGKHSIRLSYETPYLRAGAVMSFIGIIMLIMISYFSTIKRKKEKRL